MNGYDRFDRLWLACWLVFLGWLLLGSLIKVVL